MLAGKQNGPRRLGRFRTVCVYRLGCSSFAGLVDSPTVVSRARPNPDGSFAVADLAPGDYVVSLARDTQGDQSCTSDRAKATVKSGTSTMVLLEPCVQ